MTKKEAHRIGDRLGFYGADGQYRTYREIHAKPRVPVSRRIGHAWRAANKPRQIIGPVGFHNWKALGLIVLLGLGILFLADQTLKTPGVASPILGIDPVTAIIYSDNLPSGDLGAYNTVAATYNAAPGINALPNTTYASVALSKRSFDMSLAASKHLEIESYFWLNAAPASGTQWAIYFTRNGTLPLTQSYRPMADPNVVMVILFSYTGTYSMGVYFQPNPTESIDDTSGGGCGVAVNSCYNFGTYTIALGAPPAGTRSLTFTQLNYTGTQEAGTSSGVSSTWMGASTTLIPRFPWLQISAQPYHIGFYQSTTSNGGSLIWSFTGTDCTSALTLHNLNACSQWVDVFVPAISAGQPGPVDVGGFFGPVIKALISLGVWILASIATFFGYLADVFVTAMDAVGGFFGLGAIGTQIRAALVGVATWVGSVFGTIFGQAINMATAISNGMLVFTQVTANYWTILTSWLSALKDLAGIWWTFIGFWGTIGFSSLVTIWLILGVVMSWNSQNGFFQWTKGTWIATATVFNVLWTIGERAIDVILKVKKLLHPTAA